jgi:hypothetical protein
MKSWKTTLLGCVCLVCCAFGVHDNFRRHAKHPRYFLPHLALLATGLMGIAARDNDKSSEDVRGK